MADIADEDTERLIGDVTEEIASAPGPTSWSAPTRMRLRRQLAGVADVLGDKSESRSKTTATVSLSSRVGATVPGRTAVSAANPTWLFLGECVRRTRGGDDAQGNLGRASNFNHQGPPCHLCNRVTIAEFLSLTSRLSGSQLDTYTVAAPADSVITMCLMATRTGCGACCKRQALDHVDEQRLPPPHRQRRPPHYVGGEHRLGRVRRQDGQRHEPPRSPSAGTSRSTRAASRSSCCSQTCSAR